MSNVGGDQPDWSIRGAQVPLVPTDSRDGESHGALYVALPYLASGHYYVFGIDLATEVGATAGLVEIDLNTVAGWSYLNASDRDHITLDGFKTFGPVQVFATGGPVRVAVRYTVGP